MRFDPQQAEIYNHEAFLPGKFDRCWCYGSSPALGRQAPDYPLWHLDRHEPTTLHAELADRRVTVVEFGSYSCPLSRLACDSMEELADNYEEDGAGALFIYTHEAHPSAQMPVHRSWPDKLAMARRLREVTNPVRPILVDALDGACHRALGGMPNMTWIFDRGGRPVYRATWTAAESVRSALEQLVAYPSPAKEDIRPLTVERLEYSGRDRAAFLAGLKLAGPRAVAEFEALFVK